MAVHIVDVADMKVSAVKGDVLVTHALGSCLGITIHDPAAHVGGGCCTSCCRFPRSTRKKGKRTLTCS